MKKLNFAEKVMLTENVKLSTSVVSPKRHEVEAEVNAPHTKAAINYSEFQKTDIEKEQLKAMRKQHFASLREQGYDPRKVMNIPGAFKE